LRHAPERDAGDSKEEGEAIRLQHEPSDNEGHHIGQTVLHRSDCPTHVSNTLATH
jgi:hypothetical protein